MPRADGAGRPPLTVAIPLHRAAPWIESICENAQRIPAHARILVSDETRIDDAMDRLRIRLAGDPRIVFRDARGPTGWREHANALIAEAETDFFSLLPQDDWIADGYHQSLMDALHRRPSAGLAFGRIRTEGKPGGDVEAMAGPPIPLGREEPWREALALDTAWNLGVAFRGVIRRERLLPILPTPGDRFADQIWVFGIALASHLVEVPDALYIKRYHERNTHGSWAPLTPSQRRAAKLAEIRRRLCHNPGARAEALRLLG